MAGSSYPPSAADLGTTEATVTAPLILFDGVCGLCNFFVDFVLRRDPRGTFRFAPLQGETAVELLGEPTTETLKSLVLIQPDGTRYRRSAAVVRVLWGLGGAWSACGTLLWLVPLPIRDVAYRLVATSRYRLFGQKSSCRMPTEEEKNRLLP